MIHLRGPVARWQATKTWHPEQHDRWLVPNELLERTIPFHSRRELARFLGTYFDAIVAIAPPELADAFIAHCRPALEIQKLLARL